MTVPPFPPPSPPGTPAPAPGPPISPSLPPSPSPPRSPPWPSPPSPSPPPLLRPPPQPLPQRSEPSAAVDPAAAPAALWLWPLPLLAGALPCIAVLLAWAISTQLGLVPACNPFVEGCFSVSRAARHDLANQLFRAIVLPAAALQAVVWLLAARWLAGVRGARWLPLLGVLAAVALALYGSFLGTEGAVYRALRQWGTVVYFGFTCLAMLITGNAVVHHRQIDSAALRHALLVLLGLLVAMGLANVFVAEIVAPALKDRVQNIAEWWGALLMTLLFTVLALVWRAERLRGVVARG